MENTENTTPMHWPKSFQAGAVRLCPGCAYTQWGVWVNGLNQVTDKEGNQVVPMYSWEPGAGECQECDPKLAAVGICPECGEVVMNDGKHSILCSQHEW